MAAARVRLAGLTGGKSSLETEFLRVWRLHAPPGLPEPTEQFRFHPTRMWRFDFAWPAFMVAAECHGGQWTGGRHNRGGGLESDCEKTRAALLDGWLLLPFVTSELNRDPCGCVDEIVAAIALVNRRRAAMTRKA